MIAIGPGTVAPASTWENARAVVTIKPRRTLVILSTPGLAPGTGSYTGTNVDSTTTMNSATTETATFT